MYNNGTCSFEGATTVTHPLTIKDLAMYEYHQGDYPLLSILPQGPERAALMPEINVKYDPRGTVPQEDSKQLNFRFDLDRYPALVKILNRYPGQTLQSFVRTEIERWMGTSRGPWEDRLSSRYDFSYKPAHIIEGYPIKLKVSSAMHEALEESVRKVGYTKSALVRVLVERRMDEIQIIHGP